jgi:hypothetical protein
MHFDPGVSISGENGPGHVGVRRRQQNCGPEHHSAVVGQEGPTGNQLIGER